MKFLKRFVPIVLAVALTFLIGCNVVPPFPPNPEINPDNESVSYIRVYPPCGCAEFEAKKGVEINFIVRGYNSQDQWVILDENLLRRWRWTANMCPDLLEGVKLEGNGLFATFVSETPATFYVAAYYVMEYKQCVDYAIVHVK